MSKRPEGAGRWPEHLPVGALRVGRSSAHYDQAVRFYRDLVGLPVVRVDRIDTLVLYLPDAAAQERLIARMAAAGVEPASQHPYWQANGGVTYQDPDGREVVFVSWVYGRDRT